MSTTANSSSSASVDWTSSAAEHLPVGGGDTSISLQLHPEFLNYCIALSFHALRYAAVFWDTAPVLSLLFSLHLLLSAGYFAMSFCGTSVLYKLLVNPEVLVPDDSGIQNFMLTSVILLALSVVANLIAFLSPLIIFNYGYSHYRRAWKRFLKRGVATTMRFHDDDDAVHIATCCHGYTQHILATVFLLTMVGLRLPVVFDYVTVYRTSGSVVLLASLLADVTVMLGWICLWFLFTVRQRWNFKVILKGRFVWDATCNGRAGPTVNLTSNSRTEQRTGQKADRRNDRMIDQRTDRMSDHRNDQMIDQRTDNRNDQANELRIEHRSKHRTHHKADGMIDHTGDKRSDRRSDYLSPSILCGCASSKARVIQVEENIQEDHIIGCPTHLEKNSRESLPPTKRRKRPWKETIDAEIRHSTADVAGGNTGGNAISGLELNSRNESGIAQCQVAASHPVDLRPENSRVGDGADEQENFVVATKSQSALTPTPENTLVRGYRWNVRDKCGQYFRQAACYKGQCEKPFRKRPPAPPPSPAPVPHSSCDRCIDDSGTGSSPLNEEQIQMDRQSPGYSRTVPQSELRNPGIRVMSPLPPEQGNVTDPHRPVTISQSTVQLNSNTSPCPFDHQLLSKSADALDGGRIEVTMCRELSGSGSAEVIRIGAKTGALFAPYSKTAAVGGMCVVESSSNPRLCSGIQEGRTLSDYRPRSCQYSCSSLSPPVYPFLSQASLPHTSYPQSSFSKPSLQMRAPPQFSFSRQSLPQPSLNLPSPPPSLLQPSLQVPSPPQSSPPQPSLPASQTNFSGGSAELPPSTDTSSSDSANSQVLCSQV